MIDRGQIQRRTELVDAQTVTSTLPSGWRPDAAGGAFRFLDARQAHLDLTGCALDDFYCEGGEFIECDFSETVIRSGLMSSRKRTTYRHCRFEDTDLRGVSPGQARFESCSFVRSRLDGWRSTASEFVDCLFVGRVFECQFWGRPQGLDAQPGRLNPPRIVNDFLRNDFAGAELVGAEFLGGINIYLQKWPTEGYVVVKDLPTRVARAAKLVAHMPASEEKDQLQLILNILAQSKFADQHDFIAGRYDVIAGTTADQLWSLLEAVPLNSLVTWAAFGSAPDVG